MASMESKRHNVTLFPPSKNYGQVFHCSIGFGPVTAHGGVNYALIFVDKATFKTHVQPLKTLKSLALLSAFKNASFNLVSSQK